MRATLALLATLALVVPARAHDIPREFRGSWCEVHAGVSGPVNAIVTYAHTKPCRLPPPTAIVDRIIRRPDATCVLQSGTASTNEFGQHEFKGKFSCVDRDVGPMDQTITLTRDGRYLDLTYPRNTDRDTE